MDLKTLMATATTIFLAEMGDKTQLAVFGAAASTRKPLEVFLGAVAGLVLVTLLPVMLGHAVGQVAPPKLLRVGGGVLFVGIGVYLVLTSKG